MPATRFYLDENVPVVIADQLNKGGIEAVTVRDLDKLGDEDVNHLKRATEMGYVLCTHDSDYVEMASTGIEHAGIIFGQQDQHGVGVWVKFLELVHTVYTDDEMKNRLEYVR
jgi:hypothetical protein